MSTTYFTATPEQSLRARTKALWEAGDFGVVARYLEVEAADFAARLPRTQGQRLLDVACGTGNLARGAARMGWAATGVDLAGNLIAQARKRASQEQLPLAFLEADAECLPFPDASFDCVASFFGVMYAPHFEAAALEILRVCRRGGVLAFTSWTPEGFGGEYLRTLLRHSPLSLTALTPTRWGEEANLLRSFGAEWVDIGFTRRCATFRLPFPPSQTLEFLRQFHGPTARAFEIAESHEQHALWTDLENLIRRHNRGTETATLLESEYLEVIARRRG